jgi:lysophospholipase L1-like esterase
MVREFAELSRGYPFIDFDEAISGPANRSYMLWKYTSLRSDPIFGDRLHPNDDGYQAMANAIDLKGLFGR